MILTAISLILLQGQGQAKPPQAPPTVNGNQVVLPGDAPKAPPINIGTQEQATLTINRHVAASFNPSKTAVNGGWQGGMQQQDIQEGQLSFSLSDMTYQGRPCKLFRGQTTWKYKPKVRNKSVFFTPTLYIIAEITPDGQLLHTNTVYNGFGTPIQIDATYKKDSIDTTITRGTVTTSSTLYPTIDMSLFNNLFQPLLIDGLVVSQTRQLAFLNPMTGSPCQVTATVNGRFMGKLYFRQYEGYKIDTTGGDTNTVITNMVTRQGQLLQVTLPNNQDALAYSTLTRDEEMAWGTFKNTDWDLPSSKAQPTRRRYITTALPVYFTDPTDMLVPIPCCIAV